MLKGINLAMFGKKEVLANFYCLYGEVDNEQAQGIAEWILSNNLSPMEERPEVLNLIVNSPGGSLAAAWSIIDMMKGSSIPVRTIAVGEIASAGLLIFMSGKKGNRVISENTSIMSHQFGWGSFGKYHELVSITTEYNNVQKRLLKHIMRCTGLSEKEVNEKLMPSSDVWLTSDEAVKLGICDVVSSLK